MFDCVQWGDPNYYSNDEVQKRIARQHQQLADWEVSGEKVKADDLRGEQPTVAESISLSRRMLSSAPAVIWKFENDQWREFGSLAPNVLQVSFSFVDRDGVAMDGSGKSYIVRKAKRILKQQVESGRWCEIQLIPVTEENLSLNFDTEKPADKDDAVFETLADPSKRTEEIATGLIENSQVHPCRYVDGQIVPHVVTPQERVRYRKMACKLLWIVWTSERKRKGAGCWIPTRSCVDLNTLGAALTPEEELMTLDDVRTMYSTTVEPPRRGRPTLKAYQARQSRKRRKAGQRQWVEAKRRLDVDQKMPQNPHKH